MARPVVLVVDDDPGVRESFRLILEDHYEVVDVPDGPGALDVVRASAVDLVLLDIRLPGMDGIEVLERIKALDEGIEVILVTAVKTVRTAVAAMKLGAFDYLTKPFEEDELLTLSRRALERRAHEREVERVGGTRPVKIDVRFIAATNTNLKEAVGRGAFREDLYYRLNVVPVVVPPLRERIQDVPLLVDHFIRRDNRRFHKRIDGPSPEALAALQAYRWPGNVRELENVVERCVVLADGPVIQLNDLPLDVSLPQQATKVRAAEALPLNEATDQFERQIVLRVLERVGWNLTEAGRILEVHRDSLRVKLARWRLRAPGSEH